MGCLHEASIWEEYLRPYGDSDFVLAQRVGFYVFLSLPHVCDAIYGVGGGWVTAIFILSNIVLV